jgi:hypothetical protein
VQTIVNVIEPDHGIIFDPACGSGGMFVQSRRKISPMMGMKYSFDARLEFARRLSAIFCFKFLNALEVVGCHAARFLPSRFKRRLDCSGCPPIHAQIPRSYFHVSGHYSVPRRLRTIARPYSAVGTVLSDTAGSPDSRSASVSMSGTPSTITVGDRLALKTRGST